MANLQNLEKMAYSTLQDYFKLVSRRGWVNQGSTNRILVLLFAIQFWWKYSVLMGEKEIRELQRLFRCLGIDCLIPSLSSEMHDKVVINKRSYAVDLINYIKQEDSDRAIITEEKTEYIIPEKI